MSKPLRNNSMRPNFCIGAAVACAMFVGGVAFPKSAWAAPHPLIMGPVYVEPTRAEDNPAPPSGGGCVVQVAEIIDARRAPETVGAVMAFSAIQAPPDRAAWLRSVFEVGLTNRGFSPVFTTPPTDQPASPNTITAHIQIQGIWITTLAMNKTGSVFFRASVSGRAQPAAEQIYRGDKISLNMWGSQNEFNGLTNQLFANALDDLAVDLLERCKAGPAIVANTEPVADAQVVFGAEAKNPALNTAQ